MEKRMFALRGATTIKSNTKQDICENACALLAELIDKNNISADDAVSLTISSTMDITAFYPAAAVRESKLIDVPLFSCLEPPIDKSLPLCIRMLLNVYKQADFKARHVYLNEAKSLRPDLQ